MKKLSLYFIITTLFSWIIWIALGLAPINPNQLPWLPIMMLGGLSPSLFGIIFIIKNKTYNKREFLKSFLSFKQIGFQKILLLVFIILIPFVISVLIDRQFFGNSLNYDKIQEIVKTPQNLLFFILISIYAGPLTEEFGWRGFAAKKMLETTNFIKVGLIIGIIWSFWHLPLLFINDYYVINNHVIFILNRLVKEISLSLIIVFFYKKTNFSILSAMILHGLSNILVNLFLPIPMSRNVIHTCLLLITATILIVIDNRKR